MRGHSLSSPPYSLNLEDILQSVNTFHPHNLPLAINGKPRFLSSRTCIPVPLTPPEIIYLLQIALVTTEVHIEEVYIWQREGYSTTIQTNLR